MDSSSTSKDVTPLALNTNYTSCIKIAGIPILPPLITDERRKLLVEYKSQAIRFEQKLQVIREQHNQFSHQQLRDIFSIADINTSSDSSGIFTKSIDSSNKESYQKIGHSLSRSQLELCDDAITDNVMNFSSTESSPVNKTGIVLSGDGSIRMKLTPKIGKIGSEDKQLSLGCSQFIDTTFVKNPNESIEDEALQSNLYLHKKIDSASLTGSDQNDDDSQCQNSDASISVNSVLQMLPESNKKHSSINNDTLNVLNTNQINLNLSPCKDLVLKSDVLTAISHNITIRGQETNLNLSKEFFKIDNSLEQNENDHNCKEIDNDKKSLGNEMNSKSFEKNNKTVVNNGRCEIMISETPPRLVRQNSYTLDSPSPELLAFMQKQQHNELDKKPGNLRRTHTWSSNEDDGKLSSTNFQPFKSSKSATRKFRKNWNVAEAKEQWSKGKKDLQTQAINVDYNSNKKLKQKNSRLENKLTSCHNYIIPSKAKEQARSADCVYSLVCSAQNLNDDFYVGEEIEQNRKHTSPVSLKSPLSVNLDELPSISNSLDVNLKSTHGVKSDGRLSTMTLTPEKDTSCDNINSIIDVPYSMCSSINSDFVSMNPLYKNTTDDSASTCSSISLHKLMLALQNSDKCLPNDEQTSALYCQVKLQHRKQIEELLKKQNEELESLIGSNQPSSAASIVTSHYNSIYDHPSLSSQAKYVTSPPKRNSIEIASSEVRSCIRQLNFSNKRIKMCPLEYTENERKAAVIITAYAKGYLVRRLFKTERVQLIHKSIVDSLQCAANFDYTNRDNWSQADVDLHKRLILQIEDASFTFSEIFNLSTAKQMAIIRADREKKKMTRSLPEKPVVSAATQRVIMRKKMQSQSVSKNTILTQKSNMKSRQRRRSFTGN